MSSLEDPAYRGLMDCAHGFMVSQVLFAACELGVFDVLSTCSLDAATLSSHLCCDPRATELLLDTCAALGWLRVDGVGTPALYSNTELSSTFLASTGAQSQHHLLLYLAGTPYSCWGRLAQAVREGRNQYPELLGVPADQPFTAIYRSEAERLRFLRGLQAVWRECGHHILSAFNLSPFQVVCDIGGGSGALAKTCLSLYPKCHVTVFDFPEVVEATKTHFLFHQEERLDFRAGDFFQDELPEAQLYILARILHDWTDEECCLLLARIRRACAPGGAVLLVESLLDADGRGPLTTLLFSLNMLLQTRGRERTVHQYRALTTMAGFPQFQWEKTGGVYDVMLARM